MEIAGFVTLEIQQIRGMEAERNRRQELVEQTVMAQIDADMVDAIAGTDDVLNIELNYDEAVRFLQEFAETEDVYASALSQIGLGVYLEDVYVGEIVGVARGVTDPNKVVFVLDNDVRMGDFRLNPRYHVGPPRTRVVDDISGREAF